MPSEPAVAVHDGVLTRVADQAHLVGHPPCAVGHRLFAGLVPVIVAAAQIARAGIIAPTVGHHHQGAPLSHVADQIVGTDTEKMTSDLLNWTMVLN
ncbi:unnamed protein product [Pieris macdunnoughi]|uniref:Uncharacterized protein n=1 Tax=Pieris macdunnoughi TaxID=345717 RepID=A0A821RC94_9NEOP|nr:unnamed protein product [Pieris macdunnoughi]